MFKRVEVPHIVALAITAVVSFSGGARAQFTQNEFTAYNPANASSISPGLTSLYSISVDSLIPTQINVGDTETTSKANGFNLIPDTGTVVPGTNNTPGINSELLGEVEPVVIGPNGQLYQTDGHHTFVGLEQSIYGASNPTVYVQVIANYSSLTPVQFATAMAQNTQLYPFNNGVQQPVTQAGSNLISPVPTSLGGLTNDPYRGLEYSVLKNAGAGGVGHDKTAGYSDFMWADAYRSAAGTAGGSGLPVLTPAEASAAAVWSTNGSNVANLPGHAPILVNQMPGYILPSGGSINVTGQITNANLGTGAIDGSNSGSVATPSMQGLNGYTANGVVVEPQVTGLLMQLGSNNGGTVTLSNTNNTYTGGTTITAGTLIIAGDGSLGAGSTGVAATGACAGGNNYSGCIDNAVRATNGIVFESLSEGSGTLQFGTNSSTSGSAMSSARNISIGQEVANINMNGNTVTLTGNIATSNINTSGPGPLIVNGKGTLILAPTDSTIGNSLFYGNIEISKGTLQVASDAAMGATTGPLIGQIEMDNGTFQAGGNFSSVRSMLMHGSTSTYDTNGFTTSWAGGLTDVQRTLDVINSSTTANGAVTFNSLTIGATAGLVLSDGAGGATTTTVTLTNGVTRQGSATLFLSTNGGSLGGKDLVKSAGASTVVTNGIVSPWIINDTGAGASTSPYNFLTYSSSKGYSAITTSSPNVVSSINSATSTNTVIQSGSVSLTGNQSAYALQAQASSSITMSGGQTLTLGDGSDPTGLILDSKASINGGTLAFGGSEAVMYVKGSAANANTISSTITGSGGITLSGSGQLNLNTASQNTGGVVINSGQLVLNAADAIKASGGLTLMNTNSSAEPGNAILSVTANNTIAAINDNGNNSQIFLGGAGAAGTTQTGAGIVLTIGDSRNLSSSVSSVISDSGATTGTAGAITKVGSGLLDFTGGGTGGVTLNAGSTIAVNGGQVRLNTDTLANNNTITTASGTEVQLMEGSTIGFASNVTGGALLHVESGQVQLTGTGNTYAGGTTLEIGTTLVATTGTLSSANQNVTNAGGLLVLDQNANGNFTGVMSDGAAQGQGSTISGSFVKADSTGSNSGNVTMTQQQAYSGSTTVEAGTLTLGATDTVKSSNGVTLGTVGGGATANLALGANNTVQGLNSVAGNTTGVQLNGNALTVQQTSGAVSSFAGNITDTGAGSVNTTGTGGTLALSGTNQIGGTMSVGSGTTISQTGGSLSVAGNVTNNGTVSIQHTNVTWGGTFSNNGAYLSDPSTQTFNNLAISNAGSIQASAGDLYRIGGNFTNTSTQNTVWNTSQAALEFFGGSQTTHTMQLTGTDLGTTQNANLNNFAWGSMTIDSGNDLSLEGQTGGGNALYLNDIIGAELSGDDVTNVLGNGFNIYYDPYDAATAYLDGLTYDLVDGGQLIADANLPEPTSLALLLSGLGGSIVVRRRARRSSAARSTAQQAG